MLKAKDTKKYLKTRHENIENGVQKTRTQKWAVFNYSGNEVRYITKIFTKHNIKAAFRIKNTIGKLLKPTENKDKYEDSGVYKLKCQTCQGVYIPI
jgi:hypothetical protein